MAGRFRPIGQYTDRYLSAQPEPGRGGDRFGKSSILYSCWICDIDYPPWLQVSGSSRADLTTNDKPTFRLRNWAPAALSRFKVVGRVAKRVVVPGHPSCNYRLVDENGSKFENTITGFIWLMLALNDSQSTLCLRRTKSARNAF